MLDELHDMTRPTVEQLADTPTDSEKDELEAKEDEEEDEWCRRRIRHQLTQLKRHHLSRHVTACIVGDPAAAYPPRTPHSTSPPYLVYEAGPEQCFVIHDFRTETEVREWMLSTFVRLGGDMCSVEVSSSESILSLLHSVWEQMAVLSCFYEPITFVLFSSAMRLDNEG